MALLLRRKGIKRVHPLTGGLQGWRDMGFPTLRLDDLSAGDPPPGI